MLVYFGYTSCPDVCPTSLADLGAALDRLSPQERRRVQVGMVTVDPKRDTPKVLTTYLGHFFEGTTTHAFRTTDPAELARAERVLRAGHSVVLDAVFARPEERAAAEALARKVGVPFRGIWLDVPKDVAQQRVTDRKGDASDATAIVVERQFAYDLGHIDWERR